MEKFYIVSNEKFLKEIEDFYKNEKQRNEFVKRFFKEKGIEQSGYHFSGNGLCNKPFSKWEKENIALYIDDSEYNNTKFGKELCKSVSFSDGSKMKKFRKNSKTLKEFQDLCVKEKVVINNYYHREGDYFIELHMGGYSVKRFQFEGKYYLYIGADIKTITPEYEGFIEITGSQFYMALEQFEKSIE